MRNRKTITSIAITLVIVAMLLLSQSTLGLEILWDTSQLPSVIHPNNHINFKASIVINSKEWANITSVVLTVKKDNRSILTTTLPVYRGTYVSSSTFNSSYGNLTVAVNRGLTNATYGYGYGYGYVSNGYGYAPGWRYGYGYGYGYGYYSNVGYGYNVMRNTYPAVIVYDFSWTPLQPGTYKFNLTVTSVNGGVHHISKECTITVSPVTTTTTTTTTAVTTTVVPAVGAVGGGAVIPPASEYLTAPSAVYKSMLISVTPGKAYVVSVPSSIASSTGVVKIEAIYTKSTVLDVIVSKVSTLPSGVASPPGQVYSIFEIVFVDLSTNSKVEPSGYVQFKVSKDWLATHGFSKDQIVLAKYKSGKWIDLPTQVIKETASAVYYKASLKSFSLFAVIAKPKVTTTVTTIATTTTATTTTVTTTTTPAKGKGVPGWIWLVIIAIVIIAIIIAAYVYRRK